MRRLPIVLWISFVLISLVIGVLLHDLYRQGERSREERGHAVLRAACAAIAMGYEERAASGASEAPLDPLIDLALAPLDGVEGGLWNREAGFIAYGFPTYGGSTRKSDVPIAEAADIAALAGESLRVARPVDREREGARETVLTRACPILQVRGADVAWALTRIGRAGQAYSRLQLALSVLLGFVVLSGIGLTLALSRWARRLGRIEHALGGYAPAAPETLAATGDRELDRIVRAFNALGERLQQARRETDVLAERVALADRLAALGRLSAGLAHEIRNPLAAMRLKSENALATGARDEALEFNLRQIERLENLVRDLLAMTQAPTIDSAPTRVDGWLRERVDAFAPVAAARAVGVLVEADAFSAAFDRRHLGRALDNLLDNALGHAPPGSSITVSARRRDDRWTLRVDDEGPGVPESIRSTLFEPFVTARVDGTGLGLAIVREIATAHAGSVRETHPAHGASFEIELPCPAS